MNIYKSEKENSFPKAFSNALKYFAVTKPIGRLNIEYKGVRVQFNYDSNVEDVMNIYTLIRYSEQLKRAVLKLQVQVLEESKP